MLFDLHIILFIETKRRGIKMFKFELDQHVKVRSHHGGIVSGKISRRMESERGIEYQVINDDDGFSGWHAEGDITPLTILQSFYIAYYKWATAEELTGEFDTSEGLHENLDRFCDSIGVGVEGPWQQLSRSLAAAGCRLVYPFNSGLIGCYKIETDKNACHKNPERLAWVKQQIEAIYND
jgi:hypothetical protein